jgi:hypothetical protein
VVVCIYNSTWRWRQDRGLKSVQVNKLGMVAHHCNPSCTGGIGRVGVWGQPGGKVRGPIWKIMKAKRAGGMAQWESTCLASTRTCVQTLLVWVHTHTHTHTHTHNLVVDLKKKMYKIPIIFSMVMILGYMCVKTYSLLAGHGPSYLGGWGKRMASAQPGPAGQHNKTPSQKNEPPPPITKTYHCPLWSHTSFVYQLNLNKAVKTNCIQLYFIHLAIHNGGITFLKYYLQEYWKCLMPNKPNKRHAILLYRKLWNMTKKSKGPEKMKT